MLTDLLYNSVCAYVCTNVFYFNCIALLYSYIYNNFLIIVDWFWPSDVKGTLGTSTCCRSSNKIQIN